MNNPEHKAKFIVFPQISFIDYPDNENCAVMVYFVGCGHRCKDCHNILLKDSKLTNYKQYTLKEKTAVQLMKEIDVVATKNNTNKVVFTGGDPLYPSNFGVVCNFLQTNFEKKKYDVCLYTGYSIGYVSQFNTAFYKKLKFIKCGGYDYKLKRFSEKTDRYLQLASTNQNFYDGKFKLLSQEGRLYFKQIKMKEAV